MENYSMRTEVTLLQWSDPEGAVRIVGRSADPDLIDLVREFLLEELDAPPPSAPIPLRPVRPVQDKKGGQDG